MGVINPLLAPKLSTISLDMDVTAFGRDGEMSLAHDEKVSIASTGMANVSQTNATRPAHP